MDVDNISEAGSQGDFDKSGKKWKNQKKPNPKDKKKSKKEVSYHLL